MTSPEEHLISKSDPLLKEGCPKGRSKFHLTCSSQNTAVLEPKPCVQPQTESELEGAIQPLPCDLQSTRAAGPCSQRRDAVCTLNLLLKRPFLASLLFLRQEKSALMRSMVQVCGGICDALSPQLRRTQRKSSCLCQMAASELLHFLAASLAAGDSRRRRERKPMSVFKKFQHFWFFNKDISCGDVSELVQAGCFSEAAI